MYVFSFCKIERGIKDPSILPLLFLGSSLQDKDWKEMCFQTHFNDLPWLRGPPCHCPLMLYTAALKLTQEILFTFTLSNTIIVFLCDLYHWLNWTNELDKPYFQTIDCYCKSSGTSKWKLMHSIYLAKRTPNKSVNIVIFCLYFEALFLRCVTEFLFLACCRRRMQEI